MGSSVGEQFKKKKFFRVFRIGRNNRKVKKANHFTREERQGYCQFILGTAN